jgi:hypothetical protein
MKTKNLFYVIFVFITSFFVCKAGFQQIIDFEDEINDRTPLQSSTLPLKVYFDEAGSKSQTRACDLVSRTSIFNQTFLQYVKEDYNKPELTDLFTRDGSDIIQFLKTTSDLNLDDSITYVGLRLFHNKIKSCDLILGKVTNSLLESFSEYLGRYFDNTEESFITELEIIRKNLEKIIFNQLSDQFAKQEALNKSKVTQQVTDEIFALITQSVDHLQKKFDDYKTKERLRHVALRFVETLLDKTVWDDNEAESIWPLFISMSKNIQNLGATGIIEHFDDLDDLFWSLTHCFCRYFTAFGISVPTAIYQKIELDLNNSSVSFLEEPEQDEGIKTKKEHIREALMKSKFRAYAYEKKGIISQSM